MLKLRERGKKFDKKKREKKNEKKSGQGARAAELLSTSTRSREKVCRPNPSSPCPFSPRKRHYPQQQYRARPPESFVRLETRVRCKGNPPLSLSPLHGSTPAPLKPSAIGPIFVLRGCGTEGGSRGRVVGAETGARRWKRKKNRRFEKRLRLSKAGKSSESCFFFP